MLKGISDIDCVVILNSPPLTRGTTLPYLGTVEQSAYVTALKQANGDIVEAISQNQAIVGKPVKHTKMVMATLLVSGVKVNVDLVPTADNVQREGRQKTIEAQKCTQSHISFYIAANFGQVCIA